MKSIIILLFVCVCSFSCTVTPKIDPALLLSKVDSLENCVKVLSHEKDSISTYSLLLCDSLENRVNVLVHEKDSLSKIALRWEYGRDTYLYEDDFKGGNSMSWRWARSIDQLKFDTDLLSKSKIEASANSRYKVKTLSVADILVNLKLPDEQSKDYVNTRFESDRFNYLLSVYAVNAVNEAVYSVACDLAGRGETCRANKDYVANVYAGLIYREFYSSIEPIADETMKLMISEYKKILEMKYLSYNPFADY